MKKKRVSLTESEIEDSKWWCRYHKETADYLAFRIMQYFEEPTESMEGILKTAAKNVLKDNKK
tara:strand:+ start:1057 stop:1245 length:189 start_codon:yes stop_codon:yes gene_type:complete